MEKEADEMVMAKENNTEFLFSGQWLDEINEEAPFSSLTSHAQRRRVFLRGRSITNNFAGIIFRDLAGALENREI